MNLLCVWIYFAINLILIQSNRIVLFYFQGSILTSTKWHANIIYRRPTFGFGDWWHLTLHFLFLRQLLDLPNFTGPTNPEREHHHGIIRARRRQMGNVTATLFRIEHYHTTLTMLYVVRIVYKLQIDYNTPDLHLRTAVFLSEMKTGQHSVN